MTPDSIVPRSLHQRVGWDPQRHGRMAELVLERYRLRLPRDRLVRQMSIIRVLERRRVPPA
jgi:hypothetical protein